MLIHKAKKTLSLSLLMISSVSVQASTLSAAQIEQRNAETATARLAAQTIMSLSSDSDGDGLMEAPAFEANANGPTGGGIPSSVTGAPQLDPYGKTIGYCVTSVSTNTTPVFAIVTPGLDSVFQTTCAQALAGNKNGDDFLITYNSSQIQGSATRKFFGDPVLNKSALDALPTTDLYDGQIRLITSTNQLWRWNGVQWNLVGSPWAFNGNDLYFNEGNVAIGKVAATAALDVVGSGLFTGTVQGATVNATGVNGLQINGTTVIDGSRNLINVNNMTFQNGTVTGNLQVNGTTTTATLNTTGNATVGGTLGVTGVLTANGGISTTTINASGALSANSATITNGLSADSLSSSTATISGALSAGSINTGAITASSLSTSGNVGVGGTLTVSGGTSTNGLTSTGAVIVPVGVVGTPTLTFAGNTNTGIYSSAANNIDFSANGTRILNVGPSGVDVKSGGLFINGTQVISSARNLTNIGTISSGAITSSDNIQGTRLISTVATGTAPLTVASSTLVTNLNADLLDGMHATSANTASTIVSRDASGNFSAGTITANVSSITPNSSDDQGSIIIRSDSTNTQGTLQFTNNANTVNYATIKAKTDGLHYYSSNGTNSPGAHFFNKGVTIGSHNSSSGGQLRLIDSNDPTSTSGYGLIMRNDGTNFYLLPTNNNDAQGVWRDGATANQMHRSLVIGMSSGIVGVNYAAVSVTGASYPSGTLQDSMVVASPQDGSGIIGVEHWPSGWGGGIRTWDILGSSIKLIGGGTSVNGWATTSDIRVKKDIVEVNDVLNKISQLPIISYRFINQSLEHQKTIGTSAQALAELFPEAVTNYGYDATYKIDNFLSVNYGQLSAIAIQGVKEINTKLDGMMRTNAANEVEFDKPVLIKQNLTAERLSANDAYIKRLEITEKLKAKEIEAERILAEKLNSGERLLNADDLLFQVMPGAIYTVQLAANDGEMMMAQVVGAETGVSVKVFQEQSVLDKDGKPIIKPQTMNIVPMGNSIGVSTGGKLVKATWLRAA